MPKYVFITYVYITIATTAPIVPPIHPSIDFLGLILLNLCFPIAFPVKYAKTNPKILPRTIPPIDPSIVFLGDNQFAFSKNFIQKKNISVNKEFDEDKATEIYMQVAKLKEKRKGKIR